MTEQLRDLQTGRWSHPYGVSMTHGKQALPMIQSVSLAPKISVESDGQWGTEHDVFSCQTYTNTEATIEWKDSNLTALNSWMMDTNPSATVSAYDPQFLKPVDFMFTDSGKNQGKNYSSTLLCNGDVSANPVSGDLNTARKNSATMTFKMQRSVIGATIQYSRFVKGTAPFATSDDIAFDTNGVGTFASACTPVTLNGSSVHVLYAKKDGYPVFDTTQYSANTTTFTPTTAPVSTEVWEVYTAVAMA